VELRQLESFLAVVEEGQFARAARRLFLSPPAVTGHIRQLEREAGTPLLQRSPVSLTPAGERLLPHARKMIAAAKTATDSVTDLHDDRTRTLRVGVMTPGSAELTAAILRTFDKARPQTHLSIHSLTFIDFASALTEHRVDVAFIRPAIHDERTTTDLLTLEPRIILTGTHSDLADADELQLDDILDRPFVRFPQPTPPAFAAYGSFATARNGTPTHWGIQQAGTVQELMISIAAGWGIAGTLRSLGPFYQSPDICYIPVPNAPWEATALVSRRNDPRPEVRAFRTVAVTLARDRTEDFEPRRFSV
jgi:DNA-binding transcriptional LysR family regulator